MRSILLLLILFTCNQRIFGQIEKLKIDGAIQIGQSENSTPDPGTIRWTGSDFEGWNGTCWLSLTGEVSCPPPTIEEYGIAYELLTGVADKVTLNGTYINKYRASEAQVRGFDARDATFVTGDIQWGAVDINSGSSITNMVWAGGYFHSGKPWDASWDDHKATYLPDLPGRNSAAIENRSTGTTITGVYTHNISKGFAFFST